METYLTIRQIAESWGIFRLATSGPLADHVLRCEGFRDREDHAVRRALEIAAATGEIATDERGRELSGRAARDGKDLYERLRTEDGWR